MSKREIEIAAMAEYLLGDITGKLERATRTCLICIRFDEVRETCDLVNKQPPARVIAYGCEKFEEDAPF